MKKTYTNLFVTVLITAITSIGLLSELRASQDQMDPNGNDIKSVNYNSDLANIKDSLETETLGNNSASGMIDCLIEPFMVVDVASSASGVIKEVMVKKGSIVKKDQVLATLESGVEKSNVDHASAKLAFHEKKLARMTVLHEQNVITHHELEETQTEVELALHEYERAIELFNMRAIKSPFDGIVVERYISPGELTDQQKVVKLAQLHPLKIEIIAPVKLYGTAITGMEAEIWPEGPVSGPFTAEIDIVDKVIDAASGTFGISLLMANPKYEIPAGVKCTAKINHDKFVTDRLADKFKTNSTEFVEVPVKRNKPVQLASRKSTTATTTKSTRSQTGIKAQASVSTSIATTGLINREGDNKKITSTPSKTELKIIINRFISAYRDGDINRFEKLFDKNARSNQQQNLDGIIDEYFELFTTTKNRQLMISDLEWTFDKQRAKGKGTARIVVVKKNNGETLKLKKKIQIVTKKENDKVLITHLYHY